MKIIYLLIVLLLPVSLRAQIYADFSVSQGSASLGTFRVLLEHEKAPRTCANFIGLASGQRPWIDTTTGAVRINRPYYDGLTFHRLIHTFMIQGGSPNGLGTDGPGYSILDEYHPDLRHSADYVISMAKSSFPNTGGSQFFVTLAATNFLNDKHSVFGRVIAGQSIIDGFKNSTNFPVGANDKPVTPITINSVVISGPNAASFDINHPALRLPHVSGTNVSVSRNASLATMTAAFNRQAQHEYFFLQSPNLTTWSNPQSILSYDSASSHAYTLSGRTEPSYFINLATVNYSQIANAPGDLLISGKILRLKFTNGQYLDLTLNGTTGTWFESSSNRSGSLTNTNWQDQGASTGILQASQSVAHAIPLGYFSTALVNYFNPGNGFVQGWLSFHSPTSGWVEEASGNSSFRYAFDIMGGL